MFVGNFSVKDEFLQSGSVGSLVLPKKVEKQSGGKIELWPLLYLEPHNFHKKTNLTFS